MEYVFIVVLIVLLSISLYYNYKFGTIIIKLEDSIEDCLDILDKRYAAISGILAKPVFFDSQEVRQVIKEITTTRESILAIANVLVEDLGKQENEDIEEENIDNKEV
jgi:hypothetical protein